MPRSRLLSPPDLEALVQRVRGLLDGAGADGRVTIGVAGAPGAGKTTLAEDLVAALTTLLGAAAVAHLPMDGFHLADVQLDALGLRDRKGAPETFDGHGFLATMGRLRSGDPATVYVPGFERVLEQPVAAAIAIPASARVVVSEGNYLLLDTPRWRTVRPLLTEVWYADLDQDTRMDRLVARHVRFGKPQPDAIAWANGTDERNAAVIAATRDRADLVIPPGLIRGIGTPPP